MLLDVVEAKGEDLDDYLKEDFGPIFLFVFVFHGSIIWVSDGIRRNRKKNYRPAQISKRVSSEADCSESQRAVRDCSMLAETRIQPLLCSG